MTDNTTRVADVIVPERFNPYMREQSTRLNAFFRAGIIANVPDVSIASGAEGGTQVNMPFWQALSQRAQILDDTTDLVIQKIGTGKDIAVLNGRALVYGASDMSAALSGDDPMRAIGDGLAENWSYEMNSMVLAVLRGAMGSLENSANSPNVLNISALSGAAAYIDGSTFIDAGQKLGDFKDRIVGVAMHSAVESWLRKQDLIAFIKPSDGEDMIPTFQGKRVIVDDALAPDSGDVFTTYLFGPGAIGFAEGTPKVPTEPWRQPLVGGGEECLISRRLLVLHPRGVKWTGTPSKQTPTDAELANSANWSRVYDPKNIRIVRFVHKIGS